MKLIFCDIDDTLIDSSTKLASLHKDFSLNNQRSYTLTPKQLQSFEKPEFYHNIHYNQQLVNYLNNQPTTTKIIFISKSPSEDLYQPKRNLLNLLIKEHHFKFIHLPMIPKSEEQSQLLKIIDYYCNKYHYLKEVEYYDDSPIRITTFNKYKKENTEQNHTICKIKKPWNQSLKTDKTQTFIQSKQTISYKHRK